MDDRSEVQAALPGYAIGPELGRGAYGIVLAGTHESLERPVAIKQLPPGIGHDPDARNRFLGEGRMLAAMDHPHIVPIFDFVEHEGMCLLVMERLMGGTLRERMRSGDLHDRFVVAAALAAATGLAYAHGRGVLHRDVKPENLMFNGDGVLKVTDFGIAKVVGSGPTTATRAGYAIGTPAYMAPEQAQGRELGPATDVYALGTVLFEVLAGRLPYPETSDPVAALYQHVHEEPMTLAEAAPDVPLPICDAVDGAIARDVADRWPTPEAFRDALAKAADEAWGPGWADAPGLPLRTLVSVPPGGTTAPLPEAGGDGPARRRRLVAIAAAAAAVLVAGLLVLLLRPDHHSADAGSAGGSSGGGAAASHHADVAISPTKGPIGTQVNVSSVRACPTPPDGWTGPREVYLELDDGRKATTDNSYGYVDNTNPPVAADGSWFTQFPIPGDAVPGDLFFRAQCYARSPQDPSSGSLYYEYAVKPTFTVTKR